MVISLLNAYVLRGSVLMTKSFNHPHAQSFCSRCEQPYHKCQHGMGGLGFLDMATGDTGGTPMYLINLESKLDKIMKHLGIDDND